MACCCENPCPPELQCGSNCCTESETCCDGSCCADGQTCCESQCCNADQVCCGGNCCSPNQFCCADTCCDLGNTCCNDQCCSTVDCSWTEERFRFESGNYDVDVCNPSTQSVWQNVAANGGNGVLQSEFGFYGISWKSGYPSALGDCPWALVRDYAQATCQAAYSDEAQTKTCLQFQKYRWRVFTADCNMTVTDVTSSALSGPVVGEFEETNTGLSCVTPATVTFLDFYDDPEFVCPP